MLKETFAQSWKLKDWGGGGNVRVHRFPMYECDEMIFTCFILEIPHFTACTIVKSETVAGFAALEPYWNRFPDESCGNHSSVCLTYAAMLHDDGER